MNMRGSLWRCANEQMRQATNEENLGSELMNRYLSDLRWDLQNTRGPKKFVDVRAEGQPLFPEDVDPREHVSDDDEMPHLTDDENEPEGHEVGTPPEAPMDRATSVSYTHLTLPTILLV